VQLQMCREKEIQRHVHHRSPPPTVAPPPLWVQLPQPNRTRLLWLLSQLLERQVSMEATPPQEGAHEPDERTSGDGDAGA
jgi:hypothetical protein